MKAQKIRGIGKGKMGRLIFLIVTVLEVALPCYANSITFSSGHHTWTDANSYYDEVFLENDASLDFLGGVIGKLTTSHTSLAYLDGGDMTSVWPMNNSIIHLYDGAITYIAASHTSKVYLYAYNITYDPTAGINNEGYVEGYFYKNDLSFGFSCWNSSTWSHIYVIPEPTSFLLFLLGGLFLIKRK